MEKRETIPTLGRWPDAESVQAIEFKARKLRAAALKKLALDAVTVLRRGFNLIVQGIRDGHAMRKAYAELMALDDRTLADIGIRRGDIPAIACGTYAPEQAARRARIEMTHTTFDLPSAANTAMPLQVA